MTVSDQLYRNDLRAFDAGVMARLDVETQAQLAPASAI